MARLAQAETLATGRDSTRRKNDCPTQGIPWHGGVDEDDWALSARIGPELWIGDGDVGFGLEAAPGFRFMRHYDCRRVREISRQVELDLPFGTAETPAGAWLGNELGADLVVHHFWSLEGSGVGRTAAGIALVSRAVRADGALVLPTVLGAITPEVGLFADSQKRGADLYFRWSLPAGYVIRPGHDPFAFMLVVAPALWTTISSTTGKSEVAFSLAFEPVLLGGLR